MSEKDTFNRTANRVTGGIALVLVGGWLVWTAATWAFSGPVVEPRLFVAYFDQSAGIREGDAVRIQGRRAGHVTEVTVVQHEGRAQARVEFAIAPGRGSPWLREMVDSGGVPADSKIRIKPGGIRGRPQLVISIGDKDDELIKVGEEWKNTKSANQEDTFSQWQEDIDRAREQFAGVVAFFDDEPWRELTDQLANLREMLEQADQNAGSIAEQTAGISDGLDDAIRGLDELTASLNVSEDGDESRMQAFADNINDAGVQMDDLHKQLVEAGEQIERLRKTSEDSLSASEEATLIRSGLKLREMASRLRASMERAVIDPSRAGDLPPSRFWRPYFHGGAPRRGTSIDEIPVAPPGERAGVPAGRRD